MKQILVFAVAVALVGNAGASWYWPFGEDSEESSPESVSSVKQEKATKPSAEKNSAEEQSAEKQSEKKDRPWYWPFGGDDEKRPPRLSELMEPASVDMDKATDLAGDGKLTEAAEKYREALAKLERVELENPKRAATPEFSSLRNKKAIINATIDQILIEQAKANAKAVQVTDTSELEKRFNDEKKAKEKVRDDAIEPEVVEEEAREEVKVKGEKREEVKAKEEVKPKVKTAKKSAKKVVKKANKVDKREQAVKDLIAKDPNSKKSQLLKASEAARKGEFESARKTIDKLLDKYPNDAAVLNLRAMCELMQGDAKSAEKTLDQAIGSNPRDHHAYYNLASLILQTRGEDGRDVARRYYESGRTVGGPRDAALEEELGL